MCRVTPKSVCVYVLEFVITIPVYYNINIICNIHIIYSSLFLSIFNTSKSSPWLKYFTVTIFYTHKFRINRIEAT